MFSDDQKSIMLLVSKADLRKAIFEVFVTLKLNGSTKEEPEILTVEDAAAFLKLAKQTLYQLVSKKAVPFYKRNKRLYFKRTELLAWIEEGKQSTQNELNSEVMNYLRENHKKSNL